MGYGTAPTGIIPGLTHMGCMPAGTAGIMPQGVGITCRRQQHGMQRHNRHVSTSRTHRLRNMFTRGQEDVLVFRPHTRPHTPTNPPVLLRPVRPGSRWQQAQQRQECPWGHGMSCSCPLQGMARPVPAAGGSPGPCGRPCPWWCPGCPLEWAHSPVVVFVLAGTGSQRGLSVGGAAAARTQVLVCWQRSNAARRRHRVC